MAGGDDSIRMARPRAWRRVVSSVVLVRLRDGSSSSVAAARDDPTREPGSGYLVGPVRKPTEPPHPLARLAVVQQHVVAAVGVEVSRRQGPADFPQPL